MKTYLQAEDPDIMIMSETKTQAEPDIMHLKQHFRVWFSLSFAVVVPSLVIHEADGSTHVGSIGIGERILRKVMVSLKMIFVF